MVHRSLRSAGVRSRELGIGEKTIEKTFALKNITKCIPIGTQRLTFTARLGLEAPRQFRTLPIALQRTAVGNRLLTFDFPIP
jgi:site-specific recombinase XerC